MRADPGPNPYFSAGHRSREIRGKDHGLLVFGKHSGRQRGFFIITRSLRTSQS